MNGTLTRDERDEHAVIFNSLKILLHKNIIHFKKIAYNCAMIKTILVTPK